MRKLVCLFVLLLFVFESCNKDELDIKQDREKVIMRKIGHELLLLSNDSTSLVRPIVYEADKYRIQFDSSFSFLPDDLVKTIDTIVKRVFPYDNYFVQVEECETNQIVYSYEVDVFSPRPFPDAVGCSLREQPEACYEIVVQFIRNEEDKDTNMLWYILFGGFFFSASIYLYVKNKRSINDEKIKLGIYLFDSKKMVLTCQGKTIELTSKESELLNLLHESVNNTVNREIILNKVWGDKGDYVGRTLDVYISKLRKKLGNDSSIALKNIRGIGYKLIVED